LSGFGGLAEVSESIFPEIKNSDAAERRRAQPGGRRISWRRKRRVLCIFVQLQIVVPMRRAGPCGSDLGPTAPSSPSLLRRFFPACPHAGCQRGRCKAADQARRGCGSSRRRGHAESRHRRRTQLSVSVGFLGRLALDHLKSQSSIGGDDIAPWELGWRQGSDGCRRLFSGPADTGL